MKNLNPLTATDFYKTGHVFQYPEGTELVYSNFTPRSAARATFDKSTFDDKVVFFGLQGFIKWFLIDTWNEQFFNKPKEQVVAKYKRRLDNALGPDAVDMSHIEALHDLGYLPIRIKALPEGSRVDISVPMFTIVNTVPEFYWVPNYLETGIIAEIWKSCTSATIAYEYRKLLNKYAAETGAPLDFVPWQGHDFSMRGMSGVGDASSTGAGHLLSFYGTDTINAIDYLEDYYCADSSSELIGGSVPATEHSVMSISGFDTEIETFRRLITKVYPAGIVSIVSDTWDFWKVMTEYATELKQEILNRTPDALGNAKVVFRPDSGNPVKILCGVEVTKLDEFVVSLEAAKGWALGMIVDRVHAETPHGEPGEDYPSQLFSFGGVTYFAEAEIDWNRYDKQYYYIDGETLDSFEPIELTPVQKGAVECLWDVFGGTINEQGYKVLNPRVGLIYGDSITLTRANDILKGLKAKGFASSNVVFGIGSFTYQYNTRDTFAFALKATYGRVKGVSSAIYKDPVTDDGTKKSARGLLRVEQEDDKFVLYQNQTEEQEMMGELKTVFENGKLVKETSLREIRTNLGTF